MSNEKIEEKLARLETHIINLIIPIQEISEFMRDKNYRSSVLEVLNKISKSPLSINELPFQNLVRKINEFESNLNVLKEKLDFHNFEQTLGEIKYIGKRLLAVENSLKKLEEKGLKNDFQLKIQYNNVEMIESEKEEKIIHKPIYYVEDILKTLKYKNFKEVVKLRLGLEGNKIHTYVEIGKKFKLTGETIRKKFNKAIRMLRHKSRMDMIKECDSEILKKAVLES